MKKLIMSLALLLLVGGAYAQKANVNRAYNKAKAENPNLNEAKGLIDPALTNEETKDWNKTWFTAAFIQSKIFENEWRKKTVDPGNYKPDVQYGALSQAYDYYLKTDEIDRTPDEKGKVKPKYSKDIATQLSADRNFFMEAGNYYMQKEDFKNAFNFYNKYLSYPNLEVFKDPKLGFSFSKDTLYYTVQVYAGYSAYKAEMPDKAIEMMEDVKNNSMISEADAMTAYQILIAEYENKDKAKFKSTLESAVKKFPNEGNFYALLINLALTANNYDEALPLIEKTLELNEKQATMWEIKGQILEGKGDSEGAIENYKKATEIDPNQVSAYKNLGRVYFNKAILAQEKQQSIDAKNQAEYDKVNKEKISALETAAPYLEKVREFTPDDKDNLKVLRDIYFVLSNGAKYDELVKIVGEN